MASGRMEEEGCMVVWWVVQRGVSRGQCRLSLSRPLRSGSARGLSLCGSVDAEMQHQRSSVLAAGLVPDIPSCAQQSAVCSIQEGQRGCGNDRPPLYRRTQNDTTFPCAARNKVF